jgi:hypothetical protein
VFDWNDHLREMAAHIHWMASMPGAVDHARLRVKELSRSSLYSALPDLIRELMKEPKDASVRSQRAH